MQEMLITRRLASGLGLMRKCKGKLHDQKGCGDGQGGYELLL